MRPRLGPGLAVAVVSLAVPACAEPEPPPPKMPSAKFLARYPDFVDPSVFKDDAPANARPDPAAFPSSFVDCTGKPVDLLQYRGKKNVVLLMLRGFSGAHCPYCTAQTTSLFGKTADLAKYDAQLLIVYPGKTDHLGEFVARTGTALEKAPCPILLDEDFKAVDRLGLRGELAKPSTFVLDKQGNVRYAYVGASLSDRPSAKAILAQLAKLKS